MKSKSISPGNKATMPAPPPNLKMMIMGNMVLTRCLNVTAELGVADHLNDGPKTPEFLGAKTGSNTNALYRMIRVLICYGIFQETEDGKIAHTPASMLLSDENEGSQRSFLRMMGSHWMWNVFNNLEHSIKTGDAAFSQAFEGSANIFEYFKKENPQAGMLFSKSMSQFSYAFDNPIIDAYDFSGFDSVMDIGGAEGRLIKMIKQRHPNITGALLELPHVIEQAKRAEGADQLELVTGDFFKEMDYVADCLTIKYVLHNWSDYNCIKILQNCRRSIKPNGKLLIMDMLVKDGDKQVFEKSLDMVVMMLLGAKERTREEFESVLIRAGFKLNRIIPTKCPLSIMEAEPF